MPSPIPTTIRGQKYISLTTFRKNGEPVSTPVWFGEEGERLYVMTMATSGKCKRIRNHPDVRVAPCTIRGCVTGPETAALARFLPPEQHSRAHATINCKYWMAWITQFWSKADAFLELRFEE